MNENKIITVHSARMAGWLMYNGIMYMQTTKKLDDTDKLVFKFLNTERLQRIMSEFDNKHLVRKCTTCYSQK